MQNGNCKLGSVLCMTKPVHDIHIAMKMPKLKFPFAPCQVWDFLRGIQFFPIKSSNFGQNTNTWEKYPSIVFIGYTITPYILTNQWVFSSDSSDSYSIIGLVPKNWGFSLFLKESYMITSEELILDSRVQSGR